MDPHVYREEMVEFIEDEFEVEVSLSTIRRTLQREKISRKKARFYISFIELSNYRFKELLGNVTHIYDMNGSLSMVLAFQETFRAGRCSND